MSRFPVGINIRMLCFIKDLLLWEKLFQNFFLQKIVVQVFKSAMLLR